MQYTTSELSVDDDDVFLDAAAMNGRGGEGEEEEEEATLSDVSPITEYPPPPPRDLLAIAEAPDGVVEEEVANGKATNVDGDEEKEEEEEEKKVDRNGNGSDVRNVEGSEVSSEHMFAFGHFR